MLTLAEARDLVPGERIVADNGVGYVVQTVGPRRGEDGVILTLRRADDENVSTFATEYDLCVLSRLGPPAPALPPAPVELPPVEEPAARKGKKPSEKEG